jgi:hypothetical protein
MLPDMSDVLVEFSQTVTLKRVTQTIVDFHPVESVINLTIDAVVQPADKEKLNPDLVDWSLQYVLVHTVATVQINDQLIHNGILYRSVGPLGNYSDYGFHEIVFEEIK